MYIQQLRYPFIYDYHNIAISLVSHIQFAYLETYISSLYTLISHDIKVPLYIPSMSTYHQYILLTSHIYIYPTCLSRNISHYILYPIIQIYIYTPLYILYIPLMSHLYHHHHHHHHLPFFFGWSPPLVEVLGSPHWCWSLWPSGAWKIIEKNPETDGMWWFLRWDYSQFDKVAYQCRWSMKVPSGYD
jgi:hypothetical protein